MIVEAAEVEIGAPLALADLAGVESRVEKLPWVRSATATRAWPGTIQVSVSERIPVASIRKSDDVWSVVDGTGRVLADETVRHGPELVAIRNIPAAGQLIDVPELARVADAVARNGMGEIRLRAVPQRDGTYSYVGDLDRGVEVRFGTASEISTKTSLAIRILETMPTDTRYLDVSTPERPVSGVGANVNSEAGTDSQTQNEG